MGCGGCQFAGQSTAHEDTFVGVRFAEEVNLTLCSTGGRRFARGEEVVVALDTGPAFGTVERSPMAVFKPCQKSSARAILRSAEASDRAAFDRQRQNEVRGKRFCQQRARELDLKMKISKVEFSLNGRHARVFFTADARVDFRQLVRDISKRFSTRVRMIQVGARDEARILGGIGVCGQTLCCSTWLDDFRPISIAMAKRQGLSLNPSKISGQCGRLLCCLAYEDDNYRRQRPRGPRAPQEPGRREESGAGGGGEGPSRNPRRAELSPAVDPSWVPAPRPNPAGRTLPVIG
ncbi:MAG: hypothetical protein DWQ36_24725 [Acidobacteria bacterium]|nr:MAG: hypothetical protein DWQ30_10765 [Acidobacteriota bacterium]REJ99544.1 MAG: hypothetical protein DWQ36_24725 [Acidobacteriota bacterium]